MKGVKSSVVEDPRLDVFIRKRVFRHMRTAKARISLRIRAVWSEPSLSANRIIGRRIIWIRAFCAFWRAHWRGKYVLVIDVPIRFLFSSICSYSFSLQFGVILFVLSSVRYVPIRSLFGSVCFYPFSLHFGMFLFVLSSVRYVPFCSLWSLVCSYLFSFQFGVILFILSSVQYVPIRSLISSAWSYSFSL